MGQASLGRRPQSCRRRASQGEGDLLAHGINDLLISENPWMSCIYMFIQVRDETNKVQFGRMDKEQQEEMNEFKRPVLV